MPMEQVLIKSENEEITIEKGTKEIFFASPAFLLQWLCIVHRYLHHLKHG